MPSPFTFDRSWHFGLAPADLWTTLSHTDLYGVWWPWLRSFALHHDGEDGTEGGDGVDRLAALVAGRTADVVIQAPLPYQLRCRVHVADAEPPRRLVTEVDGDLRGPARLDLRGVDGGTEARLAWAFEVQAPLLRTLATVGRPAMAWAHDRIVERGLAQFEDHALREHDRLS